jgi:hypothetical protein
MGSTTTSNEGQVRTVAAKKPAKTENDVQRRMREALEAKQARNKAAHGEDHLSGHGAPAASNDVTKRQFRRKSGG